MLDLFQEFNNACHGMNNLVNLHFALMQLRGKWGEDTGEEYAEKEVHDEDLNQQVVDLINDKDHKWMAVCRVSFFLLWIN